MDVFAEVLPLVQFYLEEGITDEEAVALIDREAPKTEQKKDTWQETTIGGTHFVLLFCIIWAVHVNIDFFKTRLVLILCVILVKEMEGEASQSQNSDQDDHENPEIGNTGEKNY